MPNYELIYIVDPDLAEQEVTEVVNRVTAVAKDAGAQPQDPERWPKRRLAYEIKDKREGLYVVMRLQAEPPAMAELGRVLKLTEPVLRHMAVRLDETKPAGGQEQ